MDLTTRSAHSENHIPPEEFQLLFLQQKDEIEKLLREVNRLHEEKITATEIFSETISKYEHDITELEGIIAALRPDQTKEKDSNCLNVAPLQLNARFKGGYTNHNGTRSRERRGSEDVNTINERRSFIAVASSLMSGWTGSSGSGIERGGVRSHSNTREAPSPSNSHSFSGHSTISQTPTGRSPRRNFQPDNTTTQTTDTQQSVPSVPNSRRSSAQLSTIRSDPIEPSTTNDSSRPAASKPTGGTFWKSLMGIRPLGVSALGNWEANKTSRRFHKLLQNGIPFGLRGALWRKAIGDRLLITRGLYNSTVQKVLVFRDFLMRTSKRYKNRLEETLGAAALVIDSDSGPTRNLSDFIKDLPADTTLRTEQSKGLPRVACHELPTPSSSSLTTKTENGFETTQSTTNEKNQTASRCDLCNAIWTPAIISAFETISADLHRTLPRLGVVPVVTVMEEEKNANSSEKTKDERSETSEVHQSTEIRINIPVLNQKNSNPSDVSSSSEFIRPKRIVANPGSTEIGVRPLPLTLLGGRDSQQLYLRLRLLLESFVILRPDIGYVQGMGFLAAMLLLYIEDDYEAFLCFANLLSRQSLLAFYTFDLPVVDVYFKTFDALLVEKVPLMAEALYEAQIPSSQFLVDWMYTLFTRCLPFELVSRIWDLFLVQGDIILFQVSLGMLKHYQLEELSCSSNIEKPNIEKLSTFLSSSSTTHFETIQPDRFLEAAASVAPTKEHLLRIMKSIQRSNKERIRLFPGVSSFTTNKTEQKTHTLTSTNFNPKVESLQQPIETITFDHSWRNSNGVSAIKRSAISIWGHHRRGSNPVVIDSTFEDGSTTPASSVAPELTHSDSFTGEVLNFSPSGSCDTALSTKESTPLAATSVARSSRQRLQLVTPNTVACETFASTSSVSHPSSPDWFAPSSTESFCNIKSKVLSKMTSRNFSGSKSSTVSKKGHKISRSFRRLRSTPSINSSFHYNETPEAAVSSLPSYLGSSQPALMDPFKRAETFTPGSFHHKMDTNSLSPSRNSSNEALNRNTTRTPVESTRRTVLRIFYGSN